MLSRTCKHLASHAPQVDGFAGVFPEHKHSIVEALQARGRLVGMTGTVGCQESTRIPMASPLQHCAWAPPGFWSLPLASPVECCTHLYHCTRTKTTPAGSATAAAGCR